MKVLQKMYSVVLPTILCAAMLVSCKEMKDVFSSGIDFTKPEEVKTLNEMVNKAIPKDVLVQRITFSNTGSSSSFSVSKDKANIFYIDPEDNKTVREINVNLKTGESSLNKSTNELDFDLPKAIAQKQNGGVKLENFDFSKIPVMVNAAAQALEKKELSTDGIGSFGIDFRSGDLASTKYTFSLQHQTGSRRVGKRIQYNYNEYNFSADKDGNLDSSK